MTKETSLDFAQLGWLLHIVDPNLPIGGFNHSFGLETFVAKRDVKDSASLYEYLETQLRDNWIYNDGAYLALAYDALNADNLAEFFHFNHHFGTTRLARETKEAYAKLGSRLFKIYAREIKSPYLDAVTAKKTTLFYPLSFCLCGFLLKLPLATVLYAYYYNMLVSEITNGVKLIPLGQMAGQRLFFQLKPALTDAVAKSLVPEKKKLGIGAVMNEIRSMQHENLYTRLYMS